MQPAKGVVAVAVVRFFVASSLSSRPLSLPVNSSGPRTGSSVNTVEVAWQSRPSASNVQARRSPVMKVVRPSMCNISKRPSSTTSKCSGHIRSSSGIPW